MGSKAVYKRMLLSPVVTFEKYKVIKIKNELHNFS